MLLRLAVRDFAIVDRIEVEFADGMSVLTGETGAGKSILVDALGLVLGERGGAQLVRSGATRAEFSAEFDLGRLPQVSAWLSEHSLDADDECLLRRVINADGRSRAFINGNAVTLQQLKLIGDFLVDIHGQHFHQSLARRDVQRDLLDHFGKLTGERDRVASAYVEWRSLDERFGRLAADEAERASRIDLLTFQLLELTTLAAEAGESAALQAERQRLANSGRLADGVGRALDALYDGDAANANQLIAESARSLQGLLCYDDALSSVVELVESAGIQIAEAADELRRYADTIDMHPGRRDQVEERLDALQAVARKHRAAIDDLPELTQRFASELDELTHADERGRDLEKQRDAAREHFLNLAGALSARRRKAAKSLSNRVTEAMRGLGMPGGRFEIDLAPLGDGRERADGIDAIEFRITANAGQPMLPLAKVASGGELSRMGLAIQVIASGGSAIPTMVFDEVDAGIGGGVAEMVGRRLAELGCDRQVLCVTHLPQVASLATHHYRVAKVSDGKTTRTTVTALSDDERVEELARMLGGVEITRKTLEHAAEMLSDAPKKRA
ncbi:MAG: DNA repair protein RecN [Woeseiaceae bacterium]|nr:DNA repair protein RecN [Woeseiaceae bacterium]